MNPTDAVIARAARTLAPYFEANGINWASWDHKGCLFVPGEADIALALKEMVGQVEPGGRVDSGHLIVEWPFEEIEDDGEGEQVLATPGEIRVLVNVATVTRDAP